MKQGPQLLERVLQRCSRDEKAVVGVEGSQALVQQRVVVLQPVSLVHAQHCPVHAVQERLKTATDLCDTVRHLQDMQERLQTGWAPVKKLKNWAGTSDLSFTIIIKTQHFWQKIFIINAPATWEVLSLNKQVQSNYLHVCTHP